MLKIYFSSDGDCGSSTNKKLCIGQYGHTSPPSPSLPSVSPHTPLSPTQQSDVSRHSSPPQSSTAQVDLLGQKSSSSSRGTSETVCTTVNYHPKVQNNLCQTTSVPLQTNKDFSSSKAHSSSVSNAGTDSLIDSTNVGSSTSIVGGLNQDGTRTLRISARVQNKQKREEEKTDTATAVPHKKLELTGKFDCLKKNTIQLI